MEPKERSLKLYDKNILTKTIGRNKSVHWKHNKYSSLEYNEL